MFSACRYNLLNRGNIIKNGFAMKKGRLRGINEVTNFRLKFIRKNLGHDFKNTIDQTDRPEIVDMPSSSYFRDKCNESFVEPEESRLPS